MEADTETTEADMAEDMADMVEDMADSLGDYLLKSTLSKRSRIHEFSFSDITAEASTARSEAANW